MGAFCTLPRLLQSLLQNEDLVCCVFARMKPALRVLYLGLDLFHSVGLIEIPLLFEFNFSKDYFYVFTSGSSSTLYINVI